MAVPARTPTKTKLAVHYRNGTPGEHCGNCVMSHFLPGATLGRCDIVLGHISALATCDEWESKRG